MNYYVLSERRILQHQDDYAYLYSREFNHDLQYSKNTVFVERIDKNGRKHYAPKQKEDFNGGQ